MGRLYTLVLDAISVTTDADQDIWELSNSSAKQVILHSFAISSAQTTDTRLRMQLIRRTASGSGGSSGTVTALDQGNAIASVVTAEVLNTTPGTGSTLLHGFQWSQQGEYLYLPTPDMRPVVSVSSFLCLHLQTAAGAGTQTWSGSVVFEEF